MLDAEPTTAASQIPVTLPAQLPPAAPGRRRRRRATAGASAQPDGGGDVTPTRSQRKDLAKSTRMQGKQSKKEAAEEAKMLNRANKSGECVWHALLKGVVGLNSVRSHDQLLKCVKIRCDPTKLAHVSWNGTPFRPQECEEMMVALGRLRIESGYNCGSCDPLLSAVAGVYSINIIHEYRGHRHAYTVSRPCRIVEVSSSAAHMEHVRNTQPPS
jgi:hypothetical protein